MSYLLSHNVAPVLYRVWTGALSPLRYGFGLRSLISRYRFSPSLLFPDPPIFASLLSRPLHCVCKDIMFTGVPPISPASLPSVFSTLSALLQDPLFPNLQHLPLSPPECMPPAGRTFNAPHIGTRGRLHLPGAPLSPSLLTAIRSARCIIQAEFGVRGAASWRRSSSITAK